MITKFKLFERRIFSNNKISKKIKNILKFEVGDHVRLKNKSSDLIFYIDYINVELNTIWYHIKDDKYIYQGEYLSDQLVKLSDEEKAQLKYNL